jgi:flagellar biosynthesis/type III secretory pathway M-ring protein FliF/YscJ
MMKSEKLMDQFDSIEALIESAMGKLTKLPVELVDQSAIVNIHEILAAALEDLETEKYESCCGLQQEEEQTLEKIEKMEAELFQLRASLR